MNLSTLEAVTFEALSSFFSDKEKPQNKGKKPLLKDVFKIARQEARYKDNEISKFDTFLLFLLFSYCHVLLLFLTHAMKLTKYRWQYGSLHHLRCRLRGL